MVVPIESGDKLLCSVEKIITTETLVKRSVKKHLFAAVAIEHKSLTTLGNLLFDHIPDMDAETTFAVSHTPSLVFVGCATRI